jgi:hypothetical protein
MDISTAAFLVMVVAFCCNTTDEQVTFYFIKCMPVYRHIFCSAGTGVVRPLLEPRVGELGVCLGDLSVHRACCQEQQRAKNRKLLHILNSIYFFTNKVYGLGF